MSDTPPFIRNIPAALPLLNIRVQSVKKPHGLQELPVKRRHYVGFVEDEPLTEELKEQNRKPEPNFSQIQEYNRHQREICCILDDKIFVAESLNYVVSKVTGTKIQILSPELEPTEKIQGLTMSENINIFKIRKRDASLDYKYDI
ncbi:hypothetical protein LOZ53_004445 [Ophidiomyces ophidiicola]|nr:hypothetical protein LOZ53_004445 [Ophidiomyces ophidiicola]